MSYWSGHERNRKTNVFGQMAHLHIVAICYISTANNIIKAINRQMKQTQIRSVRRDHADLGTNSRKGDTLLSQVLDHGRDEAELGVVPEILGPFHHEGLKLLTHLWVALDKQ